MGFYLYNQEGLIVRYANGLKILVALKWNSKKFLHIIYVRRDLGSTCNYSNELPLKEWLNQSFVTNIKKIQKKPSFPSKSRYTDTCKKISLIYRSRHGNELSQLFTCGWFFFKNRSILKEKKWFKSYMNILQFTSSNTDWYPDIKPKQDSKQHDRQALRFISTFGTVPL